MSKALSRLSVAELESVLQRQRSLLDNLTSRRSALASELRDLDKQIGKLEGKRVRGRGKGVTTNGATKRIRGQRSLKSILIEILSKHKKGLTKAELMEKIAATGYKSNAQNFGMVVYLNLYRKAEFRVDDKGVYTYHPS